MTKTVFFSALLVGALIAAPAMAQKSQTVTMKNGEGKNIGTVKLTEAGDERVLIELDAHSLPPGWHGFHIHEKGDCTGPEFTSAGAHFNPDGDDHGAMHGRDFHAGDLPNIYAHADGIARAHIFSDDITVTDKKDDGYLLDKDGSAFVIHADPDDYKSPNTGNAGARIACGALTR